MTQLQTIKTQKIMKFKINETEFLVVKTPTNAWGVFKCEPKKPHGLSECIATAQGDGELQGILKQLFIKEIFKPYIKI